MHNQPHDDAAGPQEKCMSSKYQEGDELEIAHLKRELAELKARLTAEPSQRTVADEALAQRISTLSEKTSC